jgi:lipid II:glycine glycyltransferase (peptidoglycan interpeptide bridge formation enzyme)
MERNGAQARYYYPLDYFMAFFEQMPNNSRFQLAEYRDRIVAGTLYLHDDVGICSYLGGADESFQEIRPTNAVIYDIIRWSQQQGKERLILGGGYRYDDGIFRFKSSFSPLRATFDVYKRVHLPHKYKELCQSWTAYHGGLAANQDYFPIYRNVRGDK